MMKMNNPSRRSSFATLALALWLSALPAQSISAQRERQTTPTQNPAVTQPTPSPNPSPVATPSALSAVVQTKTATSTKSLAELRNRISEIIEKPELASAMVGIKVSSSVIRRKCNEVAATCFEHEDLYGRHCPRSTFA
jgi:hypothetical protein